MFVREQTEMRCCVLSVDCKGTNPSIHTEALEIVGRSFGRFTRNQNILAKIIFQYMQAGVASLLHPKSRTLGMILSKESIQNTFWCGPQIL
jgi:hypothetical protein